MKQFLTLLVLLHSHSFVHLFNDDGALDIGAFNIQVFGKTKWTYPAVQEYLPKIVLRYDLILIQEIRDKSGETIVKLLDSVNEQIKTENYEYKMVVSPRLGRTSSKEQYAFFYRTDWLAPISTRVYHDNEDKFEREPFIVEFISNKAKIQQFAVVGIHTSPDSALEEVDSLVDVYDSIQTSMSLKDVIIIGDFNTGCSYVSDDDWQNIKLATDKRFYWLINNLADTTTKGTDCPYDRIVVAGSELVPNVIPKSSDVFLFDREYGLSEDTTRTISDHYPVQMQIRSKVESELVDFKEKLSVHDKRNPLTKYNVYQMRRNAIKMNYNVFASYTKTGAYLEITIATNATERSGVESSYRKMVNDFNEYLLYSNTLMRMFRYQEYLNGLTRGYGKFQTLYNFYKLISYSYLIQIRCNINDQPVQCWQEIKVSYD